VSVWVKRSKHVLNIDAFDGHQLGNKYHKKHFKTTKTAQKHVFYTSLVEGVLASLVSLRICCWCYCVVSSLCRVADTLVEGVSASLVSLRICCWCYCVVSSLCRVADTRPTLYQSVLKQCLTQSLVLSSSTNQRPIVDKISAVVGSSSLGAVSLFISRLTVLSRYQGLTYCFAGTDHSLNICVLAVEK